MKPKRKGGAGFHVPEKKKKSTGKSEQPKAPKLKPSGEDDDFMYLLDEMPDTGGAEAGGSDSELELELNLAPSASNGEQQPFDDRDGEQQEPQQEPQQIEPKQKRKREHPKRKRGANKLSAVEWEASRELVKTLAERPPEEQADFLWSQCQQATQASALERDSLGLSAAAIVALPPGPSLEARLRSLAGADWGSTFGGCPSGCDKGSPAVVMVSGAAMGAIALIKQLPAANKACRIAKLFAKHIKQAEQEALLNGHAVACGAGTPNRLLRLAESGVLRLDRLRFLVLDMTLDAKLRSVVDLPETRVDFWKLWKEHIAPHVVAGRTQLVVVSGGSSGGGAGGE